MFHIFTFRKNMICSHFMAISFILPSMCFRTNLPRKKGGLGQMKIPLLSDITKQISKDYGVLLEDQGISLRWESLIIL